MLERDKSGVEVWGQRFEVASRCRSSLAYYNTNFASVSDVLVL
jgi:hypothetical protein